MQEIGTLDGKLVGVLVSMYRSLGKWPGKARVQRGHPNLRHAIFMSALVAIRFNDDLKAKYKQLVSVEKEKKVAILAVMRKLLVLANFFYAISESGAKIRLDQDGYPGHCCAMRVLHPLRAMDKLRSYGVAKREVSPCLYHWSHKGLNNRVENSNLPFRK